MEYDWRKSVYVHYVADKLAEMSGEVGSDPVNAPDAVYRRYGNLDGGSVKTSLIRYYGPTPEDYDSPAKGLH